MKKKSIITIESFVFVLFIAACLIVPFLFRNELMGFFKDPEVLKQNIESFGIWSPVVFILIQFIQVVIFIIPGEIPQIAGGYLFGIVPGLMFSLIGILAGSVFNFYIARFLGKAFVTRLVGEEKLEAFRGILSSNRMVTAFFLLFLIPGIPKDALCYFAGLSRMNFSFFLVISGLGRTPALLGSVLMGSAAAERQWPLFIGIVVVAIVVFLVGFLNRSTIHDWVDRFARPHQSDADLKDSTDSED